MSFVHWGLLGGVAFVAAPIVLHLVMRQKPRQIPFPALQFLAARQTANRRSLRLRHWVLLTLRVALIALVALALAQPTILGTGVLGGREAPVAAALVFDTSPRMEYRHQNRSRRVVAQEFAAWILTRLPGQSQVAVLDGRAEQAAFSIDLGAAQQRIERLREVPLENLLPRQIEQALDLLSESPLARREIYVFTDRTEDAWNEQTPGRLQTRLAEQTDVGIYVIDVGVEQVQNFSLGSIQIPREVMTGQGGLTLTVPVSRQGSDESRPVELLLADQQQTLRRQAVQDVTWQAGRAEQIAFPLRGLAPGTHQGVIRLAGDDALACDNTRYFTVHVRDAWQVLVAAAQPDDAIYWTEAISPELFRRTGRAQFKCHVVSLDQLESVRLADYRAVCLLDPRPLDNRVWEDLVRYATAGGSVALFLGRRAQPIDQFNKPSALQLLPAALVRQSRHETFLAPDRAGHPMLNRFGQLANAVPWQAYPVFRYWQLAPPQPTARVVVPMANGDPAIFEQPLGKGLVMTMVTPVSDAANRPGRVPWNTLPTGLEPWPFVMLAGEMMNHLVGSHAQQANLLVGQPAVISVPDRRYQLVSITTPTGQRIRQNVDPRSRQAVVSATEPAGNFRVRAGGADDGLNTGFSVNLSDRFSRLTRLSDEQLSATLGSDRYQVARTTAEIERNQGVGRVGHELSPWLMILFALVLAAEQLLANRFYKESF